MNAIFLWLVSIGASPLLLVPGGSIDPAVAVHHNDDVAASFGNTAAAPDAKLLWDTSGTHQLQIWLTDVDGGGTDGVPMYWLTGDKTTYLGGDLALGANCLTTTSGSKLCDAGGDGDMILSDATGTQGIELNTSATSNTLTLINDAGGIAYLNLSGGFLQTYSYSGAILGNQSLVFWGSYGDVNTRNESTTVVTKPLSLYTGAQTNAGNYASGDLSLHTGDTTTDGDTGDISLYTGVAGAGTADAGDLLLSTHGAYGSGTSGVKLWGAGVGITPPYVEAAAPTEPFTCDATHKFVELWVEDTDDTAYPRKCACLNLDGTGYDWRAVEDPTGTACPFF